MPVRKPSSFRTLGGIFLPCRFPAIRSELPKFPILAASYKRKWLQHRALCDLTFVRNEEARDSSPLSSTIFPITCG
jgi:hypothetical protein